MTEDLTTAQFLTDCQVLSHQLNKSLLRLHEHYVGQDCFILNGPHRKRKGKIVEMRLEDATPEFKVTLYESLTGRYSRTADPGQLMKSAYASSWHHYNNLELVDKRGVRV